MGSKKQHLDKNGNSVKVGDKCIYNHPVFWNEPNGYVIGTLGWDNHLKVHFLEFDGGVARVNFTYAGLNKGQCDYLVKIEEEVDESLTEEERREFSLSWPELEYIEEPELLAEELEDKS